MSDERAFPSPLGVPAGPSLSTPQLIAAYLAGARTGCAPEAHIEWPVLMAHDHLVAVHVDGAVLMRGEVPAVAEPVRAALQDAMEAVGVLLVEEESVLAGAVAAELAVPRGFEWDLWARDADEAREVLAARALGQAVGIPEADADIERRRAEAQTEAFLRQIEREW
ncbi:MAG TPA: hypothetical protein VM324_00645 [Egibacteraceae bacterium]|jgi:hypothetical protein|nr:hypothetical protein [Egibacteraceae bacterium]